MAAVSFFHTAGGVISPEDAILACYELAKYYGVDPRIFLEQTISEVERHKRWTYKLAERIRASQEAEAPEQ